MRIGILDGIIEMIEFWFVLVAISFSPIKKKRLFIVFEVRYYELFWLVKKKRLS
jgi:hypothetical protein